MYVSNEDSNSISVIDSSSNAVINTIDVGPRPQGFAFNPANNDMYLAHEVSNTVSVIDTNTNTVVGTIQVGSDPFAVTFDPSNNHMYITNRVSSTVSVIDTNTNTVVATIQVGPRPHLLAFNPINKDMYVGNFGSNTVSVIDSFTNTVVDTITVGNAPFGIAFNPTNNYMYVANAGSNTVSVIAITPIQPPTHTTITSATDGNGAVVQSGGSTVSTSITFQVTATAGTNPIAGFQCNLDGSAFSSCATTNPATISYNNLAAGRQHTFEVRAVDTRGNVDPTPATFRWTILTPTQATEKLIGTIDSFHLPRGVTTSLSAPLNAAITQLNRHNNAAACNQLNAFLNQVSQKLTSGQLTPQQAADLRQQAIAIQRAIGCSSAGLAGLAGSSSGDEDDTEDLPLPMP
jgi:YVTN family beta-propeller protein